MKKIIKMKKMLENLVKCKKALKKDNKPLSKEKYFRYNKIENFTRDYTIFLNFDINIRKNASNRYWKFYFWSFNFSLAVIQFK